MGIFQLQYFMNQAVPNGIINISISAECEKFSRDKKGEKPTLVIDLFGFMAILKADKLKTLYGGSHRQCFKTIDNLFRRLSEVTDLVFYQDGPVVEQKGDTFIKRRNEQYTAMIEMIDKVNQKIPIKQIVEEWGRKPVPSIRSGYEFLSKLATKYGRHVVSMTKECDAEIAQFACNNPSVIAVIAEDSDFLIFPGNWRYFSTQNINLETLETVEYSRTTLRRFLALNDHQLTILATIGGNDIVKYDEVRHCHGSKIRHFVHFKDPSFVKTKFIKIAEKVQNLDVLSTQGLISLLAYFLLGDQSVSSQQRIIESMDQYNVHFKLDDKAFATPLLKYCRELHYNFVHCVLQRKPLNVIIGYYDRRPTSTPNFYDVLERLFKRQIGVVLQHQRSSVPDLQLGVKGKRSHSEPMQRHFISPEYPGFEVPDLIELLDRRNFPQHDKVRFQLLKWTISDPLANIDLTSIPKRYLRHVLTLHFMIAEGFITKFDADIILLTIKDEAESRIPDDYDYPPIVDPSAFQIAFLFLDFFADMERSFEVVGLTDLAALQTFEGGFFHQKYLEFSSSDENPTEHLRDVDCYRIYRNLPDKQTALSSRKR